MRTRKLTWDSEARKFVLAKTRQPKADAFLRGPIPLSWLQAAAKLPGRSLHVGLVIWFAAGVHSSRADLTVSTELTIRFGVDRFAKARALQHLEQAGLVTVKQVGHKAPRVTLLQAPTRPHNRKGEVAASSLS